MNVCAYFMSFFELFESNGVIEECERNISTVNDLGPVQEWVLAFMTNQVQMLVTFSLLESGILPVYTFQPAAADIR